MLRATAGEQTEARTSPARRQIASGAAGLWLRLGAPSDWASTTPAAGYLYVAPASVLAGLMLGAIGLLVSSVVEQLENFAGVMNFVILPMFFASTALYRWIAAAGTTACPNVVVPSRSSSLDRDWPGNQTVSSPRRLSSDKLGRSKRPRRRSRPTHAGGN
jgi:hypothetical protein